MTDLHGILINKAQVKELWTLPHSKKPPCDATIWHYTRQGKIPPPMRVGNTNLYNRDEVIRLRNLALGI